MKTKSIILIAISLGFGLVAAIGMTQVMGRTSNVTAEPKVKEIQVLVAKNDLEINQVLQPEDVVLQSYRPNQVPEGVASSPEDINDKKSMTRVKKGSFIYLADLIEKTAPENRPIPKGYSVQAIKASLESTLYNTLKPGDRIDIIAVLRKPGSNTSVATTFLKNIEIFAVNDQTRRDDASEEKSNIKVVSLLLRPRQAEQLTLAQSMGRLQIVQRAVETPPDGSDGGDDAGGRDEDRIGASIADLFGLSETAPNPEAEKKQLELMQQVAAQAPQPEEIKDKPFEMTIITASGPVQYVWKDRASMPVRKGSEETKPEAAPAPGPGAAPTEPPQTFAPPAPPEGESVDGEEFNDSNDSLDRTEASSDAKENESE